MAREVKNGSENHRKGKVQCNSFSVYFFISTKKKTVMTCPRSSLAFFFSPPTLYVPRNSKHSDPSLASSFFYALSFIFLQQPLHHLLLLFLLSIQHVQLPSLPLTMDHSGTFFLHLPPLPSIGISYAPFQILIQNLFLMCFLAFSAPSFSWVTLYFRSGNSYLVYLINTVIL